jgi:putative transposase
MDRRSIRLPEYNYSLPGEYFITICVRDKLPRLGIINDAKILLSEEGIIVEKWIKNTLIKFNNIDLIIEIRENNIVDKELPKSEYSKEEWRKERKRMVLPEIISYLKANTAREINRLNNVSEVSFWQKNYYEHIIRNQKEYQKIADYIINNPFNWNDDKYNINT